jgi:hypothetical protein
MMTMLKQFWDKFGWAIMAVVPILGFWIGRQRALAERKAAPSRTAARAAQRKATSERNRAEAIAAAAAGAARTAAQADAAGDDKAVVDAFNKRRGRKPAGSK